MTETRRIRYGTPCEFRMVTHGQLEHFDNKPPPRPLEKAKPAVKTAGTVQPVVEPGSEGENTRESERDASVATGESTATQAAVKDDQWKPERWGGWDGTVTEFDARTMYLG